MFAGKISAVCFQLLLLLAVFYSVHAVMRLKALQSCILDQFPVIRTIEGCSSDIAGVMVCETMANCVAVLHDNSICTLHELPTNLNTLKEACSIRQVYMKPGNYSTCPSDYNITLPGVPNSFYKFSATPTSWTTARDQCVADGHKLVQIGSTEEQMAMANFYPLVDGYAPGQVFIGLYQYDNLDEPAGHWRWMGSEEDFNMTGGFWNTPSAPDNGGTVEHVAEFLTDPNILKANDTPDYIDRYYVCECLIF